MEGHRSPRPRFRTGGLEAEHGVSRAGWYHAQTTVRIAVKDKALMDQMMKANQELVNMEVNVEDIGGRPTITAFKVLK